MAFALPGPTHAASPAGVATAAAGCRTTPYPDVPVTGRFCADIAWLQAQHITTGYADGLFHPDSPITREAMAAFLFRLADPTARAQACAGQAPFRDVPTSGRFCSAIAWLQAQHITTGYADGLFHPDSPITREAMAAFLFRLSNLPGKTPGSCAPDGPYPDVPAANRFCGQIAWLKTQNITTGFADGLFHPDSPITREAMAAFLHRGELAGAFGLRGTA